MINPYVNALFHSAEQVWDFLSDLWLPLAICLGVLVLAGVLVATLGRETSWLTRWDLSRRTRTFLAYAAAAFCALVAYAELQTTLPIVRQDLNWRASAQTTTNAVPDAPPVSQFAPALATLVERTYTRRLTLPPQFLQRIGAEGVNVLSPYLSDPSAQNVLRLADTFRRSGRDVIFTRQVTRQDENPIPFSGSQVQAQFHRLAGRAYDMEFEGRYAFQNQSKESAKVRFVFTLPEAGTLRDVSVNVGNQAVPEPDAGSAYEWVQQMDPGEKREAVVHYRAVGAQSWDYDLGSERRRVQQFSLAATPDGPVRFLRGSIQPTTPGKDTLHWDLANVITAQKVALVFPPDIVGRECYLQALSALPAALLIFLAGALAIGFLARQIPGPGVLAAAIGMFTLGLGSSFVLASYAGPVAGVIAGPVAGALLAAWLLSRQLGWVSLLAALPAALVPAAFLSPRDTGLIVLALAVVTVGGLAVRFAPRSREHRGTMAVA